MEKAKVIRLFPVSNKDMVADVQKNDFRFAKNLANAGRAAVTEFVNKRRYGGQPLNDQEAEIYARFLELYEDLELKIKAESLAQAVSTN